MAVIFPDSSTVVEFPDPVEEQNLPPFVTEPTPHKIFPGVLVEASDTVVVTIPRKARLLRATFADGTSRYMWELESDPLLPFIEVKTLPINYPLSWWFPQDAGADK